MQRTRSGHRGLCTKGQPSAGVPPLPIPSARGGKPCSADGTGVTPGRVGGRLPYLQKPFEKSEGFFAFGRVGITTENAEVTEDL